VGGSWLCCAFYIGRIGARFKRLRAVSAGKGKGGPVSPDRPRFFLALP
jgi:hypothetical protein